MMYDIFKIRFRWYPFILATCQPLFLSTMVLDFTLLILNLKKMRYLLAKNQSSWCSPNPPTKNENMDLSIQNHSLRLGLCNIPIQLANWNPQQNFQGMTFVSDLTLQGESESGQIQSANSPIQFFPPNLYFPTTSSSFSIIACHVSLFPPTFPANLSICSIIACHASYFLPPQCPLISLDMWKERTDWKSDWTIGFYKEQSPQLELQLDCPTHY